MGKVIGFLKILRWILLTSVLEFTESLDDLEKMSVELFSDVENKNVPVPEWKEHPFGEEQLRVKGYIVPIKDIRKLNITFPIPDLRDHYQAKPERYISHLLGHEGPGSLLSVLKNNGWVNSLVAGESSGAMGFAFFGINVDLTEEGINHIDDIITLVFQVSFVHLKSNLFSDANEVLIVTVFEYVARAESSEMDFRRVERHVERSFPF